MDEKLPEFALMNHKKNDSPATGRETKILILFFQAEKTLWNLFVSRILLKKDYGSQSNFTIRFS